VGGKLGRKNAVSLPLPLLLGIKLIYILIGNCQEKSPIIQHFFLIKYQYKAVFPLLPNLNSADDPSIYFKIK